MKRELLAFIRCPICKSEDFLLAPETENAVEIRDGDLICKACQNRFPIRDGILNLLVDPTQEIVKEQKGWEILEKAVLNTDELMLTLPDAPGEHKAAWQCLADNFHYMFDEIQLKGGETILDLGSGRCWSSRYFARKGCTVVGIDIVLTKYVGLMTADIFIEHDQVYFERICGDMNRLPFRDQRFDIVFIAATLHHSSNIKQTLKEVARVLTPGGRLILVNEPTVGSFKSKQLSCTEIDMGINEHVYHLGEYLNGLRGAGFSYVVYPYVGSYAKIVDDLNRKIYNRAPHWIKRRVWPPLIYMQHMVYSGVLNLMARKPGSNILAGPGTRR